jgi:hypothetical protein
MTGIYTFANTPEGEQHRQRLITTLAAAGFTCREFEEDFTDGDMTTRVLRLEVGGKRKGEGQIAADMKRRKV